MNDPHVVALIYTVEHGQSISYDRASALSYDESSEFHLTVDDNTARFEFKTHYANEEAARRAIEQFIQNWEFDAGIRRGPNSFTLRFREAEIVDMDPSPPSPRSGPLRARARVQFSGKLSVSAKATLVEPHYPHPPSGGSIDPEDSAVVKMKGRYAQYQLGRAKLPEVAYFCVNVLEKEYGGTAAAARECQISAKVIRKIRRLSSEKGGEDARKAVGSDDDFTREESRFLNMAIKEIIIRAAQVASDSSQSHTKITMAGLPELKCG